ADDVPSSAPRVNAATELECDRGAKPWFRGRGDYDSGLESVQKSPEAAFDNLIEQEGFGSRAPVDGYRIERKDADGALLTYDVGDRTKIAVVVADGIHDWNDDE